jgi:outer membrane protein TolC
VDRSRSVKSQRLNEFGQAILEGFGEVEDALTQERRQKELIESLEKQYEFSGQVIQRLRDQYTQGAVDYLRVLDALLTHQALERTLLEARRQLIEYRITLYRALAGGWNMNPPNSAAYGDSDRGDVLAETVK